ncbi:MAG: FHA domain-containing protein [Acidobacteria bacterium]|nr:FHA domain-containing protein [Acidobacteriota bacterium]
MKLEIEISIETLATARHQVVRVPIAERLTLGRGPDSPVLLEGTQISREHLVIAAAGPQLSLCNLSANGTAINGAPIATGYWQPLGPGDLIQVPGYNLAFTLLGQATPSTPTPSRVPTLNSSEKTVLVLLAAALLITLTFWKL